MRKLMVYITLLLVPILIPVMNRAGVGIPLPRPDDQQALFILLKLSEKGLSDEVFRLAIRGYRKLETCGKLKNSAILTIVDFSQSSRQKRLYVIDLLNKTLLFNTYVAHGRNTGEEYATRFSNVLGSCQSSLGFYVTRQETRGASTGLSLVMEGVEKGYNDNALKRKIIMHGARYATEDFIKRTGRLGRSFGCPSLPPELVRAVVETIKEGTCLFIYHKDKGYISHSSLLN